MSNDLEPGPRTSDPSLRAGRVLRLTLVFLTLVGSLACGDETGPPGTNEEEQQHDCVPYTAGQLTEDFSSSWSAVNEHDEWTFTTPAEPGGGWVTVTLTAQHSQVVPWLALDIVPAGGTPISSGAAGVGEQTLTDVFEVASGKAIQLEVFPFVNASAEDYPVDYSLTATFSGLQDCYEPNDAPGSDWPATMSAAKAIPLGQTIEASAIVGHDELGPPSGARLVDWYKFTLGSARTLNISTVEVPDDIQVGLRVFAADGGFFTAAPVPALAGQTTATGPVAFTAGTWYIEFFPTTRGPATVRTTAGEAIPDHYTSTYRLLVAEVSSQ